jgi:hypothetical protein
MASGYITFFSDVKPEYINQSITFFLGWEVSHYSAQGRDFKLAINSSHQG